MKKLFFTTLVTLLAMSAMLAQQVTGVIVDEATQAPLPGVNVIVKGTTQGSISNLDGQYTIEVPGQDAVLVFSFVGYLEVEEHYDSELDLIQDYPDATSIYNLNGEK